MLKIPGDSKLKSSLNLVIIQFGLYLIPLISSPYIIHVVGLEKFGTYAFFQAIINFLAIFVNYGFVQSGVRDIAQCTSLRRLNFEFSRIFYAKLLGFIFAVLLGLSLLCIKKFWDERVLYLLAFLFLFVSFLDISFVFQGIEKLKDYAYLNFISSVFVLLSLFLVIQKPTDYIYIPAVFYGPRVIAILFAYLVLFARYKILPAKFNLIKIIGKIRSNFHFFLSNVSIFLYAKTNVILLGIIVSDSAAGAYAIAEQLIYAGTNLLGKVSAAYYPQIVKGFDESKRSGEAIAQENIFVMLILAISAVIFVQFFSHEFLTVLFENAASRVKPILQITSINIVILPISFILGIHILLTLQGDKHILKISMLAAIFNLVGSWILIHFFQTIGAALSLTAIELLMLVYYAVMVSSRNIKLIGRAAILTVGRYVAYLLVVTIVIKAISNFLLSGIVFQLLFAIATFALAVPIILIRMNIVDFKTKRFSWPDVNVE